MTRLVYSSSLEDLLAANLGWGELDHLVLAQVAGTPGRTAEQVADALGVPAGAVETSLRLLAERGLVEAHPVHGRVVYVPTPAGGLVAAAAGQAA